MTFAELITRFDKPIRNLFVSNFPFISCFIYSYGRQLFLKRLFKETPPLVNIPSALKVKVWNIEFRTPLFNAAGMFKNAEGYLLSYRQGAGAYLVGTVTTSFRKGNTKKGIKHPFMPYPKSQSSSNWLGLPNKGYEYVARRIQEFPRFPFFPIGVSIASNLETTATFKSLLNQIQAFDEAGVDFIELNESCPNIMHQHSGEILGEELIQRLEFIYENYLKKRTRNLPVVVKFSNDFPIEQVKNLIDLLIDLKYDGLNFGNTSTNYFFFRDALAVSDRKSFDFFINHFGGGLAGAILKNRSYELTAKAIEYIHLKTPPYEFQVIRTGGIVDSTDLLQSYNKGVILHQWFTGYFENFTRFGHLLYKKFFENINQQIGP